MVKIEINQGKVIIIKYALSDGEKVINLCDLEGNLTDICFFDTYKINEHGHIIIGVLRDGLDYYNNVVPYFDLRSTKSREIPTVVESKEKGIPSRLEYSYVGPTNKIEDIIPEEYNYRWGAINKQNDLSIYPQHSYLRFSNEDTCVVGELSYKIKYGYKELLTGKSITPICYTQANDFHEGMGLVKYNNFYGYVNRNKTITNPDNKKEYNNNLYPSYFSATDFKNGEAVVTKLPPNPIGGNIRITIDKDGNLLHAINVSARIRRKIAENR